MNTALTAGTVAVFLIGSAVIGGRLRRLLPQHHLSADTKETVRLAMGLTATMAALLLGLLVSSAKESYDTAQSEVNQMGSKVMLLDRLLVAYGSGADVTRDQLHILINDAVQKMWPREIQAPAQLAPNTQQANAFFFSIHQLDPSDETQRSLKADALKLAFEIGELRSLLQAQSAASFSQTMLCIVVFWLVVIFLSFSLFAPDNSTASLAIMVSAMSVAGAMFLLLELDRPLDGLIQISRPPAFTVLHATKVPTSQSGG